MAVEVTHPDLDEIIAQIGEAGRRLFEIGAAEGAAGNISVYLDWPVDPQRKFPIQEEIELPVEVPALIGATIVLTGSGCRLRAIKDDPLGALGVVIVNKDGKTASLHTSANRRFKLITSEFNSHLAVHQDAIGSSHTNFHTIIHAQPYHLTYLSNIPRYQNETYLSRHLLRWQPEMIIQFPEGVGYVPFLMPGSRELMVATAESLRSHCLAVWGKHGVVTRSDISAEHATDRIEYVETAARYEYMNLVNNEMGEGLTTEEIRIVCRSMNIQHCIA